jgi:glycosyltransferase involved in cell wall biosynthesis
MKIACFEAGLPNCEHDAGSTAIVELCILAKNMGNVVEYVYNGHNPWGRVDDLERADIETILYNEANTKLSKQEFLQQKKYDLVIISRPGPASQWLYFCNQAKIPVVYFGHDIHYLRLARGNNFLQTTKQKSLQLVKALEQNIWQNAQCLIYPTAHECEVINKFLEDKNLEQKAIEMPIYNLVEVAKKVNKLNTKNENNNDLLFVGGEHHAPNYDGILWFANEILPKINHGFTLNIVGNWSQNTISEISTHQTFDKKIIFHGQVSEEKLFELYNKIKIVIVPLRFGAGVKRKVIESLAFKKITIGTDIAFEGIDLPQEFLNSFQVNADANLFAKKITEAFENKIMVDIDRASKIVLEKYNDDYRKKVLEKAFAIM